MSTLTLLIFLLLALCFHSKVHFKSSVDLGSICSNDVKHLKGAPDAFNINTSPKHFSLKTGFLLHLGLIHTFILYLLHFIFSFVDIYANMLSFRVKPYLSYPLTLACYNNYQTFATLLMIKLFLHEIFLVFVFYTDLLLSEFVRLLDSSSFITLEGFVDCFMNDILDPAVMTL